MLTIILLITLVTLNQSGSVWDIAAYVLEVSVVGRVSEDDVVWNTLDSLLGWLGDVKDFAYLFGDDFKSIDVLQVIIFFQEPVSISEFNSGEEERKVLINVDL